MKLYAIKDIKAGLWLTPFTAQSDVQAARSVVSYMKQQSSMSDFADDYQLYYLADYVEDVAYPIAILDAQDMKLVITGTQARAMALELSKSDS